MVPKHIVTSITNTRLIEFSINSTNFDNIFLAKPLVLIIGTKKKHIKGLFIGIVSVAGALISISGFFVGKAHYLKLKRKGFY